MTLSSCSGDSSEEGVGEDVVFREYGAREDFYHLLGGRFNHFLLGVFMLVIVKVVRSQDASLEDRSSNHIVRLTLTTVVSLVILGYVAGDTLFRNGSQVESE